MQPLFSKIESMRGPCYFKEPEDTVMSLAGAAGWGEGVNMPGKADCLTGFSELIHPGAKKAVETRGGIPQLLSIPLSALTFNQFTCWPAFQFC